MCKEHVVATFIFCQHCLAVPFIVLPHLNFRYLILNNKIVIYLVHIQGMADFFDQKETVKTLFFVIWIHSLKRDGASAVIFKEIPHFDGILSVCPCAVKVIEVSNTWFIWCCVLHKFECIFHIWHQDEWHC